MKAEQLVMFQNESELKNSFIMGYEKARQELKEQAILLEQISEALLKEKRQLLERMKPEIIDFCLKLTEQLIRQELSEPEVFAKLISSLLMAANRKKEPLSVLLAPEDLALIEQALPKIEGDNGHIYFYADPSVQRGDVRIQGDSLLVNCALKRELESVRAHVLRGSQ